MGLDMYVFSSEKEEICYWRKEPAIHKWFQNLADTKGIEYESFNGIQVPLTREDILKLSKDICSLNLDLDASGFFFGSNANMSDSDILYFKSGNLSKCIAMLEAIDEGKEIYYDSWW